MYEDLPPYHLWYRTDLAIYYVRFHTRTGRIYRRSLGTGNETEAHRRAPRVIADVLKTGPVAPKCIADLFPLVRRDYELNGHRSLGKLNHNIERLSAKLAGYRIGHFSTADALRYVEDRKREGAANGTINRELAIIRRGFNLAVTTAGLSRDLVPEIATLQEAPPRAGFFEAEQFETLLTYLPPEIQPVALFGYETGWRLREIITLQWRQLDLAEGSARLDPGTTKNRQGRVVYLSPRLLEVLRAQARSTRELERKKGSIIPWVFHRRGGRILRFLASWRTACKNAGVPGRFFHDLRRTAVRNMVRAGIPERVAMQISGHKTRSVFERYNIVSEGDLREAAKRLASYGQSNGTSVQQITHLARTTTHQRSP